MRKMMLVLAALAVGVTGCELKPDRILVQPECAVEKDSTGQCWACCRGFHDAKSDCPVSLPPKEPRVPPGGQVP